MAPTFMLNLVLEMTQIAIEELEAESKKLLGLGIDRAIARDGRGSIEANKLLGQVKEQLKNLREQEKTLLETRRKYENAIEDARITQIFMGQMARGEVN